MGGDRCSRLRRLALAVIAITVYTPAPHAHAACNLIPAAARTFPSDRGSVTSPITAPGKVVEVTLGPCDPVTAFDPTAANDAVSVRFETPDPDGTDTLVAVAGATVEHCAPGGGCVACTIGACNTLRFVMPDTDDLLAPASDGIGLAGPARVLVEVGVTLVAEIGTLYQPTTSCDRAEEATFHRFTVLPLANDVQALCAVQPGTPCTGSATRVLLTVDGDGNLLVPLDHTAVLPAGPGSPIAVLEKG